MGKRRADRDRCVHARDDVGDGNAGALRAAPRRAVGLSRDAHHPAHALDHEVVTRALAIGAGLAESGQRAIDEAAVLLAQVLVAEAVARKVAVLVVFDQDVAAPRELARDGLAWRPGDIQRDRFLAAVSRSEIRGILGLAPLPILDPGRTKGPRIIAASRPLDLDDFGTQICHVLAGPGTCQYARQVENP